MNILFKKALHLVRHDRIHGGCQPHNANVTHDLARKPLVTPKATPVATVHLNRPPRWHTFREDQAASPDERADYQPNKVVRRNRIEPSQDGDDATCRIYPGTVTTGSDCEKTLRRCIRIITAVGIEPP